ncbi:MAG: pitrilysin family protein [Longimicrobiales bacterium]
MNAVTSGLIPYHTFTLGNGLRVYVHEHHATPIVSVNLWYHVGSRNERPGRTGFAHLFEHLMFEGSRNVPHGQFDALLEEAGAINNGSTNPDRTNYWETLPSTALELGLYLEGDRMGGLLDALTQRELDAQRDVVKNERRQSYENRPYGLASETMLATLYPPMHPYHWPTIGSMADLDDAELEDVQQFFRTYYVPGNATLAVAGDVRADDVERLVSKWFGDIPAGGAIPDIIVPPMIAGDSAVVLEDSVQLPRLYLAWHTPALYARDDAELDIAARALGDGKASRLFRSLVYESQVAQSVSSYQSSASLGSTFRIVITARQGVALGALRDTAIAAVNEMARNGITQRELDRARNGLETGFIDALQNVGGFGGRADQLNHNVFYAGDAGYADHDMARYKAVTTERVGAAVHKYLLQPCVTLSVVPRGEAQLAVPA